MNIHAPICKSCLGTRVKAKLANLVVQSTRVLVLGLGSVGYFWTPLYSRGALWCPAWEWGTYFYFTTTIKESPDERPHAGSHRKSGSVVLVLAGHCCFPGKWIIWYKQWLLLLFAVKTAFVSTRICTSANVCSCIFVSDLGVGPQRSPNPLI